MKTFRLYIAVAVLSTATAYAARIDMSDPKRALGREDDIRVDAQLYDDSLASNAPIRVVYQVHNLTPHFIAIADKVCEASYDSDSRTIVVSIGAEIPDVTLPHLVSIAPGEKKVFNAGTTAHVITPTIRSPFANVPRFVQITVNVLRDTTAFAPLIAEQSRRQTPVPLPDELFDKWLDSTDAIRLNTIPVRWTGSAKQAVASADQRGPGM
jgi:hypothetical protein